MYCKGIVLDVFKKKIFVFSAARFIISEWLMTRNYPDVITYAFCKKRVVTAGHDHTACMVVSSSEPQQGQEQSSTTLR
jgi:hypothetical protein